MKDNAQSVSTPPVKLPSLAQIDDAKRAALAGAADGVRQWHEVLFLLGRLSILVERQNRGEALGGEPRQILRAIHDAEYEVRGDCEVLGDFPDGLEDEEFRGTP